jgi:hypothetical protein
VDTYRRREVIARALAIAGAAAIVLVDAACGRSSGERTAATAGGTTSRSTTSRLTAEPPTTSTTTTPKETTTTLPVVPVEVICRQAWGASPAGGDMIEHTIDHLTIHHTAVAVDRVADGPSSILSHQRFHQGDKGWADIAYHYLIDPGGNIYEGRDPRFKGDTATDYDPAGHFLVCIDGNFDLTTVNEAQVAAAARILAWGAHRYGVDPTALAGHRDYAETRCPGDAIYALLTDGSLVARVQAVLAAGTPSLDLVCGPEGDSLIDSIESSDA